MDLGPRLSRLAKITDAPTPVVSVYLNTRWADEHQRDRVRVFLKNEIKKAREADDPRLDDDLDWVQREAESLIQQARFPEAHGVAIFACQALGLRELLPVRTPFEDALVVGPAPFVRPLAGLLPEIPSAMVVFVDGESARLIPVNPEGAGEEVLLESEVPGHHRRGGWALLAQSRYQRHIQDHRGRHFEAVVEALLQLTERNGVHRIVLAGEPRNTAAFRRHLPERIAARVVGSVPGARYDAASLVVDRAMALLVRQEAEDAETALEAVLTEAAKGRQAVAGLEETLEAVQRGAVHRLYLLKAFREPGRVCGNCRALRSGAPAACPLCGGKTAAAELGEAMVARVIAAGGRVDLVGDHRDLIRVGGVAARLRYPL